jgi:hypothetical protein
MAQQKQIMSRTHLLAIILIFMAAQIACHKGYHDTSATSVKLSPKELEITDISAELVKLSDELLKDTPSDLSALMSEFTDRATTYNNVCLRFGPNTLDARGAFDKLWYQTTQVDKTVTDASYPNLYTRWQKIRDDYVRKIGRTLGYRMPESKAS